MDGWIKQWGYFENTNTSYKFNNQIDFKIAFSNTDYMFTRSNKMPNSTNTSTVNQTTMGLMLGFNDKETTYIVVGFDTTTYIYGFDWIAEGY